MNRQTDEEYKGTCRIVFATLGIIMRKYWKILQLKEKKKEKRVEWIQMNSNNDLLVQQTTCSYNLPVFKQIV